jgi:hypothetical protein
VPSRRVAVFNAEYIGEPFRDSRGLELLGDRTDRSLRYALVTATLGITAQCGLERGVDPNCVHRGSCGASDRQYGESVDRSGKCGIEEDTGRQSMGIVPDPRRFSRTLYAANQVQIPLSVRRSIGWDARKRV